MSIFIKSNILVNSVKFLTRNNLSKARLNIAYLSTNTNQSQSSNQNLEKQKTEAKMDQFKNNPYFSKYETKLKALYNENPEAFLTALKNKKAEKVGDGIPGLELLQGSKMAYSMTKKRKLDSIMKVELLTDLPSDEIKNIWVTYMKERGRLADMLNLEEFETIKQRSQEFKTFIFALPREHGYEFILCQWSANESHFTPLINYQAHGENAPSVMNVIYFDDLVESKKVIFEMTEVDHNNLKLEEANFLLNQMKLYYLKSKENDDKYKLINCFNKMPNDFKHMDIVKQIELDNLKVEQFKV